MDNSIAPGLLLAGETSVLLTPLGVSGLVAYSADSAPDGGLAAAGPLGGPNLLPGSCS